MKIFIMTDMEGVAGVVNRNDWVSKDSRYYESGRKLLTGEVNAAVEGFYEAGADEIFVADGHGPGGIDNLLLDKRVYYLRIYSPTPWPFGIDEYFDAIAWVGQHAKAGTPYAHICHTGTHNVIDCTINGISVGEFGEISLCAAWFGVKSIFGSGDEAFTREAELFAEGIETVSVKRGLTPGEGNECTFEEYNSRNISAVHLHPERARELIRAGAKKALTRFNNDTESFKLFKLSPPFKMITKFRPSGGNNGYTEIKEHEDDIIKMLNSKASLCDICMNAGS